MTSARVLPADYDGMAIDYASYSIDDDRNVQLLDIAQREMLLEHQFTTIGSDGLLYYGVLCNGTKLVLGADEVPTFVVSQFVAAGKDVAPVAYRKGLTRSE